MNFKLESIILLALIFCNACSLAPIHNAHDFVGTRGTASSETCQAAMSNFVLSENSKPKLMMRYPSDDLVEFNQAAEVINEFYSAIYKNTPLQLPRELFIHTKDFEYGSDGVLNIMVQAQGFKDISELRPGIFHELGHLLSSDNLVSKKHGKTIRQILLDEKIKIDLMNREFNELGKKRGAATSGRVADAIAKNQKILKSKIDEEKRKLSSSIRGMERYDEFFADLVAISFTNDSDALGKYFKIKLHGHEQEEVFNKYLRQRDFSNPEEDIIYFNGLSIDDDPYLFLLPVRQHLYKYYINKENFEHTKYNIITKVHQAINEEFNGEKKDFIKSNISLIKRIDELLGESHDEVDLTQIKFIPATKMP